MRTRRESLPLCLACLLACSALSLAAQAQDPEGYRETVAEAVREFQGGRWAEARALFRQAHRLSPNARTLRGLGMTAYELRMYGTAISELERALAARDKPLTGEQRTQSTKLIAQAARFVGRYRLELSPASAAIEVDGKPALITGDGRLMLDVGVHEVRARADGHVSESRRIRVEGGESASLRFELAPEGQVAAAVAPVPADAPPAAAPPAAVPKARPQPPPPAPVAAPPAPADAPAAAAPVEAAEEPAADGGSGLQTAAWVSLVGAGVFGIASGVFWAVGGSQFSDIEGECASGCTVEQIDDSGVETSDTLASVFLGLAVVSGVTGGVLFAVDAASGDTPDAVSLRITPGGATLRGRF